MTDHLTREARADFYRSLVGNLLLRVPSETEVDALVSMGGEGDFDFGKSLAATLESPEFQAGPLMTMVTRGMAHQRGFVKPEHCTFVSLGAHCISTWLLKVIGARTWSGPFDWIWSNVGMVADVVDTDFAALLDPSELIVVRTKAEGATHGFGNIERYRRMYGYDVIYNHHDLTTAGDVEHFRRAIARFLGCLRDPTLKVFFMVAEQETVTEEGFAALHHLLTQRCSRFRLVVIRSCIAGSPDFKVPRASVALSYDSGQLIDLHVSSRLGPLSYPNVADHAVFVDTTLRCFEAMIEGTE